jgi:signal transduction histidine kinase
MGSERVGVWRHVDLVLAAVLAAAMAVAVLATSAVEALARAGAAVAAVGLLGLAGRRRRPLVATVVAVAVVIVGVVAAPRGTEAPAFLALMVAGYSLGAHARPVSLLAGLVVAGAGVGVAQVLAPSAGHSHASAVTFFVVLLVCAPVAVGLLVRVGRSMGGRLRTGTAAIRAEAAGRVAAERAAQRDRIGSDIEELLLSGMERMRPHAEARDLAAVTALRDLGREVLGRLRTLLVELRGVEEAPDPPRTPGQGLAELRAQIERALATQPGEPPPATGAGWGRVRPGVLLTLVAGGYALVLVSASGGASRPVLSMLAAAGAAVPLAASGRAPLAATVVSGLAVVAYTAAAAPPDPLAGWVVSAPLIVVPLAVGAFATRGRALAGLAVCLATVVLVALVPGVDAVRWVDVVSSAVFVAGGWIAGRVLAATVAALAADAREAGLERDRQAEAVRAALDADRARVARDLHDAVGHAMTAIVLQAGAAARIWHQDPCRAGAHAATLRATVTEALDGLRPLVARVALDGGRDPGMTEIPGLVNRARTCGLLVDAELDVVPDSAERDAIAYRIVQEALTNASRYAPGAHVRLRLRTDRDTICLHVENDCPPYRPTESAGSGHGLRGMAERVGDCGGTLEAGPTPGGGFRVTAVLPRARPLDGVPR